MKSQLEWLREYIKCLEFGMRLMAEDPAAMQEAALEIVRDPLSSKHEVAQARVWLKAVAKYRLTGAAGFDEKPEVA